MYRRIPKLKSFAYGPQRVKDINMYDFVNDSTLGGLCVVNRNIADNDNGKSAISSCDICSLYPYVMTQKFPIGGYKWIRKFNENRYGQDKII